VRRGEWGNSIPFQRSFFWVGLGEVNFFGGWELSQGLLFRVIIIQTIIINLRTYCPKYGLMIVFIKQILLSLNV
jgi:hypothetical protein